MRKEKKITKEDVDDLYNVFISLKTKEDCENLFADLCTITEVENMAQRLKAAKLLLEDKTYNQVTALTDVSSATLSRISRCIQQGKGYRKFIKLKQKKIANEI